jgi:redox-sensing transcriptional repressor
MAEAEVPDMVVARLPLYLRTLRQMEKEGHAVTSSQDIAARLGLSPAQIRKDLSYFGKFGKQGTGYNVTRLRGQLEKILRLENQWPMALIGAGALGQALLHYGGFRERGFHIAAVFDSDPGKIGLRLGDIAVQPPTSIVDEVARLGIRVAVVAVPAEAAQEVATLLVKAGVGAILNYAPISLSVPPGVQVQQIDPVVHLQHMTFYLDGITPNRNPA